MAGRQNPRRAKTLRCYSLAETAELYSVHRNTVRLWQRQGLKAIDAKRLILFRGAELNRFHTDRRQNARKKCRAGEMYCLRCREPRRPALDMVEYIPKDAQIGKITAICPVCEGLMTQHVNAKRLADFQPKLASSADGRTNP